MSGCKICKKCGRFRPLTAFSMAANTRDGYNSQCRDCRAETYKAWVKTKNGDTVWPRNRDEVVADAALMAWRYPVSSVPMLRVA